MALNTHAPEFTGLYFKETAYRAQISPTEKMCSWVLIVFFLTVLPTSSPQKQLGCAHSKTWGRSYFQYVFKKTVAGNTQAAAKWIKYNSGSKAL